MAEQFISRNHIKAQRKTTQGGYRDTEDNTISCNYILLAIC